MFMVAVLVSRSLKDVCVSGSGEVLPCPAADVNDEVVSSGPLGPLALPKPDEVDEPENVLIISGLGGLGLDGFASGGRPDGLLGSGDCARFEAAACCRCADPSPGLFPEARRDNTGYSDGFLCRSPPSSIVESAAVQLAVRTQYIMVYFIVAKFPNPRRKTCGPWIFYKTPCIVHCGSGGNGI